MTRIMERTYSLAYLTVSGCSPAEMTYIAARTGYDYVSFRLIPMNITGEVVYTPADAAMMKKTKAALQETGIGVLDLELARIVEDVEPRSYVPAMETMAQLGARHVITSAWTKRTDDRNFIVERFAELCDLAEPYDLTVNLEFPTFSRLTDLQETADIVRAADRPNGGILIDTLYYHYSGVSLDEIKKLPHEWINFLHICDTVCDIPADPEGMRHVARDERLYCGEGCIDFHALLDAVPMVPCSIELPHAERVKKWGYEEHARRCLETAKNHFTRKPVATFTDGDASTESLNRRQEKKNNFR